MRILSYISVNPSHRVVVIAHSHSQEKSRKSNDNDITSSIPQIFGGSYSDSITSLSHSVTLSLKVHHKFTYLLPEPPEVSSAKSYVKVVTRGHTTFPFRPPFYVSYPLLSRTSILLPPAIPLFARLPLLPRLARPVREKKC